MKTLLNVAGMVGLAASIFIGVTTSIAWAIGSALGCVWFFAAARVIDLLEQLARDRPAAKGHQADNASSVPPSQIDIDAAIAAMKEAKRQLTDR